MVSATTKAPGNKEMRWHLVQAYVVDGDTQRAREVLKILLADGTAFEHRGEAEALLNELNG